MHLGGDSLHFTAAFRSPFKQVFSNLDGVKISVEREREREREREKDR